MTMPAHLYHGTSAKRLRAILKKGLAPRGNTKSQWQMASRPDHVYLTEAYATHYGREAVAGDSEVRYRIAVLRLDASRLDTDRLYADEDALEQSNRPDKRTTTAEMVKRTEFYRDNWDILQVARNWQGSLQVMGNCSHHGTIPAEAITGVTLIDPASPLCWACDPMITLVNYSILGDYYRALMAFPWEGEAAISREYKPESIGASYLDRLRKMPLQGVQVFERPRDSNARIIAAAETPLPKPKRKPTKDEVLSLARKLTGETP